MSVTTYTTVNGMILSQAKGGVVSHFVPDPLGSVVMVRDTSGNTVYEAEYDPYGNVQSETGTNPSSLGYVGTLGYIKDSAASMYVRPRYLLNNLGRWLTKDPLWPSEPGFVYAGSAPSMWVDPSGMIKFVNCDQSFQNKVNKICARLKELTPRQKEKIKTCVARTSRASNQSCPQFSNESAACFQNFCNNGQVECDPDLGYAGYCPSPTVVQINPNYGGSTFIPKDDWIGRLTFLHEVAHACGVDHGKYGHESKCQCNDIYSCCIFEVLMGRTGNYCVDTMKEFLGKGGNCNKL